MGAKLCGTKNDTIETKANTPNEVEFPQLQNPEENSFEYDIRNQHSNIFLGIFEGSKLYCLDKFQSKFTQELMYKWRFAEVKSFYPDGTVNIHFINWSEKHDITLNTNIDIDRLAPFGLLELDQIENGHFLTPDQFAVASTYFLTGQFPDDYRPRTPLAEESAHLPEANQAQDQLNHGETLTTTTTAESQQSDRLTSGYITGMMVDIQDFYPSARVKGKMLSKWRKAEIRTISGDCITIHYIGWSEEWNETLHVLTDSSRIAPANSKTNPSKIPSNHSIVNNEATNDKISKSENIRRPSANAIDESTVESTKNQHKKQSATRSTHRRHEENGVQDSGSDSNSLSSGEMEKQIQQRIRLEREFEVKLLERGLHLIEIPGDGNCLFRAISYQLYGSDRKHLELRKMCVKHMFTHRDRFQLFCDDNFDKYLSLMQVPGTWGAEMEIRALEEIFDRLICIYSSESPKLVPMKTNFDDICLYNEQTGEPQPPLLLSYHGRNHYNSIFNERNPLPLLPKTGSDNILRARIKNMIE